MTIARVAHAAAERLLVLPQYALPHHALSRVVHALTRWRNPLVTRLLIRNFVRCYGVDLGEAESADGDAYASFNAFFTRALRAGARPAPCEAEAIACPVDGVISHLGKIAGGTLLQAKGRPYDSVSLLAGDAALAAIFADGLCVTVYLSPRDYHRIHMPLDGVAREVVYVPGRLFSVNPRTTRVVDRLFARNERVISIFDTPAGCIAVVMVGALFVGSMELAFCDLGALTRGPGIQRAATRTTLARGAEIGRFNLGSTVILLLPRDAARWSPTLAPGDRVRMGQPIGSVRGGG